MNDNDRIWTNILNLTVINPTVSKFEAMNLQGPSYIYAIISDARIH
ncbi:MAG: hypothetical protein PHY47_24980 [Lachnospiraceae bacterium]|nr:hypothetical protein [Lachnospiraceae bacterium]